jgi:hypothetical protein
MPQSCHDHNHNLSILLISWFAPSSCSYAQSYWSSVKFLLPRVPNSQAIACIGGKPDVANLEDWPVRFCFIDPGSGKVLVIDVLFYFAVAKKELGKISSKI